MSVLAARFCATAPSPGGDDVAAGAGLGAGDATKEKLPEIGESETHGCWAPPVARITASPTSLKV